MKELTQVNFSAIILAAGDFPSHPLPLHLLQKAQNLVVCDGAVSGLIELGIEPTAGCWGRRFPNRGPKSQIFLYLSPYL